MNAEEALGRLQLFMNINLVILVIWMLVVVVNYGFAVVSERSFRTGRSLRALLVSAALYFGYQSPKFNLNPELPDLGVGYDDFAKALLVALTPLVLCAVIFVLERRLARLTQTVNVRE